MTAAAIKRQAEFLELEREQFILDCHAKLALVERGLIRDPKGTRERELAALIARHSHPHEIPEEESC